MSSQKPGLHPRNRHHSRYDLDALRQACPALSDFYYPQPGRGANREFCRPAGGENAE